LETQPNLAQLRLRDECANINLIFTQFFFFFFFWGNSNDKSNSAAAANQSAQMDARRQQKTTTTTSDKCYEESVYESGEEVLSV
jgi:hypothetical protein